MKLFNNLQLTTSVKPTKRNPTIVRRVSLLNGIEKQLKIVELLSNGETEILDTTSNRSLVRWFWLDESGSYFLSIKYGKGAIELEKNKFSILCKDLSEVKSSLLHVKGLVITGKLDTHLEKRSIDIRKNFGK